MLTDAHIKKKKHGLSNQYIHMYFLKVEKGSWASIKEIEIYFPLKRKIHAMKVNKIERPFETLKKVFNRIYFAKLDRKLWNVLFMFLHVIIEKRNFERTFR